MIAADERTLRGFVAIGRVQALNRVVEIEEQRALADDFLEDARAMPAPAAAASSLGESEVALIRAAVEAAGGNISEAAKRLGISRNTIYRKLRG